ncbi:hypothetical protein EK21DRAFT_58596 [Setomelanomma holmii]|uniref:Uncharacterized protein n=1 Tax=Setomelanomma holmii TaxID=210430 RepID=A0A9P4HF80_9PLEO|nr:hypothetical protein EK21DRAFT_58596 [Setomelanomma holmii]
MAETCDDPFRFLDLPGELRNKVYALLLCYFSDELSPHEVQTGWTDDLSVEWAVHDIDTAILRVSSLLHREAFDVMVKVNRFVRIWSNTALPLQPIVVIDSIPVVMQDVHSITTFKGYVLDVCLSTSKPLHVHQEQRYDIRPCSLVIRARDLHLLSEGIMHAETHCPDFSTSIVIDINVAPILDHHKMPRYEGSFAEFFSESIQQALLAPFRTLCNMENFTVRGHVLPEVARSVAEEARMDEWSGNPQAIIRKYESETEEATKSFHAGHLEQAAIGWARPNFEILRMKRSNTWNLLVARGGQNFVDKIAELLFLLCLNSVCACLLEYSSDATDPLVSKHI